MSRVHLWMDGVANVWSKALSNCTVERKTIAGLMRCWLVLVGLTKEETYSKHLSFTVVDSATLAIQYNMWTNKSYGIVVGGKHEYRIEEKNGH